MASLTASGLKLTPSLDHHPCYAFKVEIEMQIARWGAVISALDMMEESIAGLVLGYDEQSYAFLLMLGTSAREPTSTIHYHSHQVFDAYEKRKGALELLECADGFTLDVARGRAPKAFKRDRRLPDTYIATGYIFPLMHNMVSNKSSCAFSESTFVTSN